MTAAVDRLTPSDIRRAAEAVVERYTAAPASETEAAIALLALWVLDAVEAGRMTGDEANRIFVLLDVSIGELDGPRLSEGIQQLVVEGEHFHHFGEEHGADPQHLKDLAFAVLQRLTV
jgi:hypothetical protein